VSLSAFYRSASHDESQQLAALVEQLRERLGAEPPPSPQVFEQLEDVLSRLVMRNQRWRVLQKLERKGSSSEHIDAIREVLSRLDAELLQELPVLLEHLSVRH
jgi:murein L,D-transpeptidase YcbB/YkuD